MPLKVIFLDTTVLGLVTQKPGRSQVADACILWEATMVAANISVCVLEVADFEIRRELIRASSAAGIIRLELHNAKISGRYLPIDTATMREAATLWASARNKGLPTAPAGSLDGDAIIAGQTRTFCAATGIALDDAVIASSNARHLGRFVQAAPWQSVIAGAAFGGTPNI